MYLTRQIQDASASHARPLGRREGETKHFGKNNAEIFYLCKLAYTSTVNINFYEIRTYTLNNYSCE